MGRAQLRRVGNGVQVGVKSVPFAAWMGWLDRARREQRVRVAAASASSDGKPGVATVSATLQPSSEP